MTLNEIGAVLGIVIASSTAVGGAGKYYLDTEYVSESELEKQFLMQDVRALEREKGKLERLPIEMRTPEQIWEIQKLEEEINRLKFELQQTNTG